jgi:hypothetical protein
MDAHENARDADRDRRGHEQETEAAMEGQDREGDGERDAGMIAREGVVRRVVDEQHGLVRVVDEGPVV